VRFKNQEVLYRLGNMLSIVIFGLKREREGSGQQVWTECGRRFDFGWSWEKGVRGGIKSAIGPARSLFLGVSEHRGSCWANGLDEGG